jgi:hypothetical protein
MAAQLPDGILKCIHRARLFPLPALPPVCKMPLGSARNRRRFKIQRHVVATANRTIATLNRLYSPPAARSHTQQQSDNSSPRRAADPPSAAQQRLLAYLRDQSARLVLKVRAWCHHGPACDITQALPTADVFMSFLFTPPAETSPASQSRARPPTQPPHTHAPSASLEGPLPDAAWTSIPLPLSTAVSSQSTVVVPLIARRVALPDDVHRVPLSSVLPPDIAAQYYTPDCPALLRDPLDVQVLNRTHPLRPPRVAGSRSEYVKLIGRLARAGMLGWTASPRAVNGVFCVFKDADADRLIVDAQPANRLFVASPHVDLPNPSHLVLMQVPAGAAMSAGKSDLANFYHYLGLPAWLQPFFCLPALSPAELESLGLPVPADGRAVHPMCASMPMGWSHAVYLAQTCHEWVVYSSGALRREDSLLRLSDPLLSGSRCLHGIVIDDLFLFSLSQRLATEQFERVLAAYRGFGFVVKPSKVVAPTTEPIKVIGMEVCGREATIAPCTDSLVHLLGATLSVLRRGTITGNGLAHLIGRWTWYLLLRRPALSVLQHVYRFQEVARGGRFTVWPTVRRELWQLVGLLPLLTASLRAPLFHRAVATDASELAAGVVSTPLTPALTPLLWPLCASRRIAYAQCQLNSDSDANPLRHLHLLPTAAADQLRAEDAGFQRCYDAVADARWSTVLSRRWDRPEHINVLELRAALYGIHWVLSHPTSIDRRLLLLVDNTVALYSIWKGRSSAWQLLAVLRKIAALSLGSGLTLLTGWLPSAVNPADAPSREAGLSSDDE